MPNCYDNMPADLTGAVKSNPYLPTHVPIANTNIFFAEFRNYDAFSDADQKYPPPTAGRTMSPRLTLFYKLYKTVTINLAASLGVVIQCEGASKRDKTVTERYSFH